MMSGIVCIFMALFGVGWTVLAGSMAPFMAFFGLIFVAVAVVMAVYNIKNAKSKNRYSSFDITEHGEEPDPFNEKYGNAQNTAPTKKASAYCPCCGAPVLDGYKYCADCGKKLPPRN